jgi:hypothetical protein
MIWGYPLSVVIISELLHCIAGLLSLAPVYLTLAGSSRRTEVILGCILLFCISWQFHVLLDYMQAWF